ncbi:protein-lysine methyltransferase METTL21C-like [Scleropages formosus]|uniref:Protein-lysine methyltransferase METTL21C-like n=1 Tax=Scleropages formosus TaxID=113540 RepID=A0A0P7TXH9_SCLFO|nr:protein-lysine methyltransferase METTL21C-like [Scleropages formosus]
MAMEARRARRMQDLLCSVNESRTPRLTDRCTRDYWGEAGGGQLIATGLCRGNMSENIVMSSWEAPEQKLEFNPWSYERRAGALTIAPPAAHSPSRRNAEWHRAVSLSTAATVSPWERTGLWGRRDDVELRSQPQAEPGSRAVAEWSPRSRASLRKTGSRQVRPTNGTQRKSSLAFEKRCEPRTAAVTPSPPRAAAVSPELQPLPVPLALGDKDLADAILHRRFCPSLITTETWEGFEFAGLRIRITESTDCYGAVLWPSALVLCHFLDTHREEYSMEDKSIIELGAGTGLVSIVTALLGKRSIAVEPNDTGQIGALAERVGTGAKVTATDLPDVLGNLRHNVSRNTRGRCRHAPLVTELTWGQGLEERFPRASCRFDYILAADVVYAHPHLEELMRTFEYLCQERTVILWAMRFRLDRENRFVERVARTFDLELLYDLPTLRIRLFRATRKPRLGLGDGDRSSAGPGPQGTRLPVSPFPICPKSEP